MNRTIATCWTVAATLGTAALLWSGASAARARTEAVAADRSLERASEKIAELARLRSLTADAPTPACLPSDLPARISGVLTACGLPSSAVRSFGAGASAASRPGATLVLDGPTLPQFGAFLEAWRQAEPGWMVAAVDLSPRVEVPATGGDLPLHAVLTLEAIVPAGTKERAP